MSTSVWTVVILACAFPSLLILLHALRRWRATPVLWFVAGAFYLRFLAAALHEYTYDPVLGPLSLNAMLSVATVAVGVVLIDRRLLLFKLLWPIYLVLGMTLLSGVVNGTLGSSVETFTKWSLLLLLTVALVQARLEQPVANVLDVLIRTFALPVLLQCVALAVGYAKVNEIDGSVNYIAGYHHEAAFSIILGTLLALTLLRYWQERGLAAGAYQLLPLFVFALFALVNYRTAILALLLPFTIYLLNRFVWYTNAPKLVLLALAVVIGAAVAPPDLSRVADRFADVHLVLADVETLIQRPEYYTGWQQQYMSTRPYLWSQYVTAWADAPPVQQLVGMGPDTWDGRFITYAHNSFVSFLYELGVLGVAALTLFFVTVLTEARRSLMLLCLSVGFVILNLGTQPLWLVEGIFFMSILAAMALGERLARTSDKLAEPSAPRHAAAPAKEGGFA